ncbi:MAG: hypothetical protein RL302_1400 [Pseudomonadota bacterium]|jgi:flagellar biosynthesis protein FlhF
MNIQRFTAATSREALAKARMAFGDGTLILSNRPTEHGVEVVATAEDTLVNLSNGGSGSGKQPGSQQQAGQLSFKDVVSKVEEDADQLSMSTLSFQDYVRERMARKRQETLPQDTSEMPAAARQAPQRTVVEPARKMATPFDIPVRKPAPISDRMATVTAKPAPAMSQNIVNELQAMKDLIEDRFNTLTWLGQARQNPVQSNMMLKMIRSGYSPTLSRAILERVPEELDENGALRWVMDILERNLHTDEGMTPLHEEGGIFALVGATGVGKTTTAAKLAGLCASVHGPGSVGLITLDTYRIGAHEQLRAYGKMLGVVAHLAHDKAALQDLLGLLSNKKLVLIDTTGIAPRDPRKRDLMNLLDLPNVKRLLVLNAGGHGDTLDDAISCFKTGAAQEALLSKTDEAVKLGPAIDAAIRHQLVLRGITTGQRVPEDWEPAVAANLVRMSMRTVPVSAFDPNTSDLGFFFSQSANRSTLTQGRLDA